MTKILLAEDNDENREMLLRRLVRRGFEVVIAVDGEQAVAMAMTHRPDLVLMDMNMPVLDGWEATRRIRAVAELKGLPIIAVTAHGMSGDRDKILEAGCDDIHPKPVELPRLLGQIELLLGKS